jgi:O-succinylhomoserine sulfhydrylase
MSGHKGYREETGLIRTRAEVTAEREHSSALYLTSSYLFDDAEHARALFAREVEGNVYSRYTNPNTDEFVDRMCLLEEAEAGVSLASGMAAVFTPLAALLDSGDHVLASRSIFGSTHQILTTILPRWGITHTYADILSPEKWEGLVQPNTKICFVETPTNPGLDLVDLEWLGRFCRERDIVLFVDNVFATPILQKPIRYGADLVMHSATKYIDGQGRGIGGVVVGRKDLIDRIATFARHTGPALSPFNAWMFSKGLETLPVRMERHCDNALRVAQFLETHPQVSSVRYPHLPSHPQYELARRQMKRGGGIVSFTIAGGLDQGRRFLDSLQMCSLSANLGDTRTIATHPASTTHHSLSEEERLKVGILPGLIRLSIGLEHVDDIIADIDQALLKSAKV